jgi:hypothetical protein
MILQHERVCIITVPYPFEEYLNQPLSILQKPIHYAVGVTMTCKQVIIYYDVSGKDTTSIPVSKLNKATPFTDWNFHRDNFPKLQKWLSEILITDFRIKPSNKYL